MLTINSGLSLNTINHILLVFVAFKNIIFYYNLNLYKIKKKQNILVWFAKYLKERWVGKGGSNIDKTDFLFLNNIKLYLILKCVIKLNINRQYC